MNKPSDLVALRSLMAGLLVALGLGGCPKASVTDPNDSSADPNDSATDPNNSTTDPNGSTNDPNSGGASTGKYELWSNGLNLRGANLYQRRVYPDVDGDTFIGPGPFGPPQTQDDFNHLAALGANYVNLSVSGVFTETPPYQLDPAALANLDDLVAKAAAAHLYVVIALRSGPGRSEFAIFEGQDWFPQSLVNNTVWTSADAQDGWVAMWAALAQHFSGNPTVIGYDLMVEPNGPSTIYNEWDPVQFDADHGGSLADWNQLHPRIAAAIRAADSDTPILVNAAAYGSVDWLPYLKPTGVGHTVYVVHFYDPMEFTHQDPGANIHYPGPITVDGALTQVNPDYLRSRLQNIDAFRTANSAPVAMTEFGVKRWAPGAETYFADMTGILQDKGVNHSLWLWESSYPGLAETDDFNFRHGPDPANHADVADSALEQSIRADFSRNSVFP